MAQSVRRTTHIYRLNIILKSYKEVVGSNPKCVFLFFVSLCECVRVCVCFRFNIYFQTVSTYFHINIKFIDSVGRCVCRVCICFGKRGKHTFSCRKIYFVEEKRCFQFFACHFNVKVTSQSDVPQFGLFKGLNTMTSSWNKTVYLD